MSFLCLNMILKAHSYFYCIAVVCYIECIHDHEWFIEKIGIFIKICQWCHNYLSIYSKYCSVDQLFLYYSNLNSNFNLFCVHAHSHRRLCWPPWGVRRRVGWLARQWVMTNRHAATPSLLARAVLCTAPWGLTSAQIENIVYNDNVTELGDSDLSEEDDEDDSDYTPSDRGRGNTQLPLRYTCKIGMLCKLYSSRVIPNWSAANAKTRKLRSKWENVWGMWSAGGRRRAGCGMQEYQHKKHKIRIMGYLGSCV